MTFGNKIHTINNSSLIRTNVSESKFLVHGQGVILFKCKYPELCVLYLHNEDKTHTITLQFTPINIFGIQTIHQKHNVLLSGIPSTGLTDKKGAHYWVSLDSQKQRLYAGIGEARIENILYYFQFTEEKSSKKFLESLTNITWSDSVKPFLILRDPITSSIPLKVASTDSLTLDQIDSYDEYIPHSYLSEVCQKLYSCVSGKQICLDTEDFPDFSKAIQHSIITPGLWCYETLKKKATEFDKEHPNDKETYLRITLGENSGESPGVPFVMEIWPSGHFSPVHNHGGANAIIRVLHGSINVKLYSFLCEDSDLAPFAESMFIKDEVTWITPNLNQVHQLSNTTDDVCVTIQCYMYDTNNSKHYDYFDFLDTEYKKEQFEPDSDMRFNDFKQLMRKEYYTECIENIKNNVRVSLCKNLRGKLQTIEELQEKLNSMRIKFK
jgi:predicted metal-dependent enzyme (double-stranded beta helix superfamily)